MIDPLTQVWNRGAILEVLNRELARTQRAGRWLTLVFADIDHFKEINDGFGHGAGDEALCAIAGRIRSAVRPYDAVGRYGGDEFMVVIAECQDFVAQRVAERIRQRVAETEIDTSQGPVPVTVSLGIASAFCPAPEEAANLIGEADAALYRAKKDGRNRVAIEAPSALSESRKKSLT